MEVDAVKEESSGSRFRLPDYNIYRSERCDLRVFYAKP
jgi:hypothetical protein